MGWTAAAIVGGGILGGLISSNGAKSAAGTQADAANHAADVQQQMYDQTRADQAPWRQAGATSLGQLSDMTAPGGSLTHTFNKADLTNGLAPNYDFIKQQGSDAINNSASVGGGLVGGNALKGLVDYNQNAAGSAYQQAFDNYNTGQQNIFNRLSAISGLGQQAGSNSTSGGSVYGGNIGNNISNAGAAQAGGIVGSSNALSGSLSNIGSMYMANNMTGGKLFGGASSSGLADSGTYAANGWIG